MGRQLGNIVGCDEGNKEGNEDGLALGCADGNIDGYTVGNVEGPPKITCIQKLSATTDEYMSQKYEQKYLTGATRADNLDLSSAEKKAVKTARY